ncbi:unnamed protein product [Phyllotreta striolata]|uniref:Glucose-methanol-choline oxidoreductase N-terminal domain-containing protein n=1 Tax=Phyllotreta striolata TaxID=444603 RepID=A0A9N9TKC1_PHYSR|nr:unnamed protein product [Phyllotreta striolata]
MLLCGCEAPNFGPYLANNCGGSSFVIFMSLVDAIIRNTCDVSAVCDRVKPKSNPDPVYDYIVIGGGSGGSAVGGRLAEMKNRKTLLLEAGIDEPETYQVPAMILAYFNNPLTDWGYRTEDEPNACKSSGNSCLWLRGKVLGGCSVINGMMYTRGTPADFDVRWTNQGIKGWTYKDVLPFFKKSEGNQQINEYGGRYHGSRGPMVVSDHYYVPDIAKEILKGAAEVGFPVSKDLNGDQYTGFAIPQSNVNNGARESMAKAYLRPHRNDPNLHIMLNSTVTKILIDCHKKAYGVQFVYRNETYTVKARREIVLAAGTVNSPKILLQSGVGPKDALDAVGIDQIHDLPGVGHNLTNHVAFGMDYSVKALPDLLDTVTAETITEYLNSRTGPLSSPGLPVTSRLPSTATNSSDPDIQMFFQLTSHQCVKSGQSGLPADPKNPQAVKTLSISTVYLHTQSRGRVTLKSNNPLDPPHMVGNYLTVKNDEDRLIDGIRLVQKLVSSPTLKDKWGLVYKNKTFGNCAEQHTFDSEEYWRCAIRDSTGGENHQCSTLKMGSKEDKWSVVDEELRVIGIRNLMVADASAIPVVTSSNTNAPIVMVAERAADFIKRKRA